MFRHILLPLDGSPLSETAIPAGVHLARLFGARVSLLHVMERNAPREVHGERHLDEVDEAERYLAQVAAAHFPGMEVAWHVHTSEVNDVARGIARHVEELGADLVVMCTHGRGGLRGWLFGRIANQVVRGGGTPVLLIPPGLTAAVPTFRCRRLLVTLDGDVSHEQGLPLASSIAQRSAAEVALLMVVPTRGTLSAEEAAMARMMPAATAVALELAEEGAAAYLQRHLDALRHSGLTVTAVVRRGDPVSLIVETAGEVGADLVVIATHGKAGLEAFWAGSPTPDVSQRSLVPLLLVPVN